MSELAGAGRRWRPWIATALVVSLWAAPVEAQETPATAGKSSGREHRVRRGDTLWDLARYYLNDPFRWGLIYEANRGVVSNPHRIYPNDRLVIPEPGAPVAAGVAEPAAVGSAVEARVEATEAPGRTIFYRGVVDGAAEVAGDRRGDQPIFVEGEKEAVVVVQPAEYLAAPWLADPGELPAFGKVLRLIGHGEDRDKVAQSAHPGDRLYIERRGRRVPEVGTEVLLAREGRRVRGWGRVISPSAVGVVEAVERDVITVAVRRQFDRVEPGDIALPLDSVPEVHGRVEPVEDGVAGTLLGFAFEQPVYGTAELGFVDLGTKRGIGVGDELEVFIPTRELGGWNQTKLPEERVARLRVIRVEERTATVRVLGIWQSTIRAGLPVRLVGKLP